MAVRAAASLCVHLARKDGCAILLPGERRPIEIGHDLGAWPAVHARLALVRGGRRSGRRRARPARRRGDLGHGRRPSDRAAGARAAARRGALSWLRPARSRACGPRSRWPAAPAASSSGRGAPPAPGARHERRARPHAGAGHRRRAARVGRQRAHRCGGHARLARDAARRLRGAGCLRCGALGPAGEGPTGRPHAPCAGSWPPAEPPRSGSLCPRPAATAGAARARRRDRRGDARRWA